VPHGEAETEAVDDEGEVLDLLVQRRRDKAAAQGASVFRLSQAGSVSKPPRPVMKQPLDRVTDAYERDPSLQSLLLADHFRDAVTAAEGGWRQSVSLAIAAGIPAPAFSSTLAYYDGLRRARGPANLLQGLRDYFGAHTYRRLDKPGVFHTRWAQDGAEVQVG
jgi:6-phosphogluconate dehydrogenase